ncbi:hypothetical protein NHX12_024273 [Muraenolepis orangiensis]|uniref:INTS8 TPR repeats domain-containing protein n=1 Tax=Muraenolepis orangiensis TaxID=630683 RepID=A0A9Q0IQV3_9TELE|nr:hypothetical protein NHX12_024273 [Muraenolepis orangiensis]
MSTEAAERVSAAPGGRAGSPVQTSWFEFLLDASLLESHLHKANPDPTAAQLIVQFLEQASKPSVNEQNQVQPPVDNRRNRTLKLLALKIAAHMRWDLDLLEKGLSIPVLNMLLNELLCVSKVPPGVKHVDLDLSTLPPTTAMAVLIYNRWAIRTIVLSSFPEKQTKPGPHQMNMLNIVQQEKEMTENILIVLKEQSADSISVLEGALQLQKDLYVHTVRTLDLLGADAAATANGETEASTAGLRISAHELHCQGHYDLGAIYFQQGCTDQGAYEKAREHFRQTRDLLQKLGSSLHVHLDEKRLAGYWNACRALTGTLGPADATASPYGQINSLIRTHNHQALVEALIKDNTSQTLPNHFRQSVLREFLHKAQQGERGLDDVCHQLCVCNAVRDALQGEGLSVRFHQLLLKPSKRLVDFILEVCTRSLEKDRPSETSRRNMANFMKTLCESLEELPLVFVVSSHKLFMELLREEERKVLVEQMRKRSATINLSAKPLPSFYDIPASVSMGQLEQQLILSLEPRRVRQILIDLHGIAQRHFWRVNSKWEVPPDYINVILGIKDHLTKDLVYILMAKGLHCVTIKDFGHARQLFSACLELVTEFSPRLRQVMLNEMLLLEMRAHETLASEGCRDRPPSDLVSRVRGYLEMRIHAFMLNWRENDYLTLQVPPPLVQNNPYIKLGQLLASTCKELPGPKESRRTAKELWEVVVQICSVSKFITFIKKLREPLVLTALISLLVRLHSIVRDDIVNEVTAEHLTIWPSTLANLQAVDVEAVAITVKELVSYALTLNPNNQSWLVTQADIYFVTSQYSAALHFYLQAGAVCSDFFTRPVPPEVYTDQVLKRMIKCCSMLNCHTQVAVLCQFLREVDYMTAFKALQEQNGHDAMDSFYDYIWDVTILEYLTHIHHKRGESEKRQIAAELNTSNPEEVLQLAAQKRKKRFLQAMAKLYF